MIVAKPSGEELHFKVRHTFSEDQIEWFKAGSALNKIKTDRREEAVG